MHKVRLYSVLYIYIGTDLVYRLAEQIVPINNNTIIYSTATIHGIFI